MPKLKGCLLAGVYVERILLRGCGGLK